MFKKLKNHIQEFQATHYMVVILAIALQIQITLFADGNYLGLRVSMADMLLPFFGGVVLYSLIKRKSKLPKWSVPFMNLWLFALVIVMSAALLNGYIVTGVLSSWALVNKYIGLLLLISYFLLGGWIVTNSRDIRYIFSLFMGVFTIFFVFCMFLSVVLLFLRAAVPFSFWLSYYPWDGFMANRNAFMVCFVMSFIFIIWSYMDDKITIPHWARYLFWLSMPMFFIFNDSRTGWIVAFILGIILFLKDPVKRGKAIAPIFLLGAIVAYFSYYVATDSVVLEGQQAQYLLAAISSNNEELEYFGDQKRYIAVEDGLELFRKYNPLIGAGLGSYKPFQIEKRGEFIEIIDFTALWLLVETGALGLLVFASFFIACIWSLYRQGYALGVSPYHRAMLAFLIMFALMSVLHELMYTRMLWFALGLAIATAYRADKAS